MNKPETNSTKTFEVEYTEADLEELRQEGYSEDELPKLGLHTFQPCAAYYAAQRAKDQNHDVSRC